MSVIAFKAAGDGQGPANRLSIAFDRAMSFAPERTAALHIDRPALLRFVEEEAAFGRIVVDDRGLTAGARLHALQPARHLLAEWKTVRNAFEMALEPRRADIDAVDRLDSDVAALRHCARDELTQVVETWRLREHNKVVESDWSDAKVRYNTCKSRNGGRVANMAANTIVYWMALILIGLADWLINYDTFFAFTGVPAIAIGATCILGVLLAFGAHGHGEVLKQWSHRFGSQESQTSRMSSYRLAGLATVAVAIVLLAAGGSRYGAALRTAPPQALPNILGAETVIDFNPLRDVLLSLLANIGAWIVGVFVSYFCHDVDPEFMQATRQHRREGRRYNRARRSVTLEIEALEEQCSREVVHLQVETLSKAALVAHERGQLAQVAAREKAIVEALASAVKANAEQYRDLLAQHIMARRGGVQVFLGRETEQRELSPYDFMSLDINVDVELIASLVP